MTVKVNDVNTNLNIKIPNWLIINRVGFGILKIVLRLVLNFRPIYRLKYRYIKPFLKKALEYEGYEIVTIRTQQNADIRISL